MFEKQSQDYAMREVSPRQELYIKGRADIDADYENVKRIWREGAEYGFNKANEWHYPSKGEYPKDDKDMLMSEHLILLTKMKGTDNLSISLGQYNFSTQEFSYQHIVGLTDVIAWKEVVFPELPKESK